MIITVKKYIFRNIELIFFFSVSPLVPDVPQRKSHTALPSKTPIIKPIENIKNSVILGI